MTTGSEVRGLWQTLPQTMPYKVHIDPGNLCNFNCPFCPTGNPELLKRVGRPKGMMKMNLYKKLISDFKIMVQHTGKRIEGLRLHKDGEPLLQKNLFLMIRLAKEARIANSVETTTNGDLLTPNIVSEILQSGLDTIRISVKYLDDDVYDHIRYNVRSLTLRKRKLANPLHVHVTIVDTGLSQEQKKQFSGDFGPISDSLNIDGIMGWSSCDLHDFTLGLPSPTGIDGISPKKKRIVCPEPFTKLAINFDGSVSVCCVDWTHGTIVGDATHENIQDIWTGGKLRDFRLKHLKGERSTLPVCFACDYVDGFRDFLDLDNHRAEILPLYKEI